MDIQDKYKNLKSSLAALPSVLVAFSGGVDSTFLLAAARDALGGKAVAVTAVSNLVPEREAAGARDFCEREGIEIVTVEIDANSIEGFAENPRNRCYLCKTAILKKFRAVADERGITHIAEGSNADDEGDYRPGSIAVREQGVLSPLLAAGLTKAEIRELSKSLGLPTWDKPSFACLASRVPYGEALTAEKLKMIDKSEQFLLGMGLRQVRVRCHGAAARIETDEAGFRALTADAETRSRVHDALRSFGFTYAAIDLAGYRTGSMDE